MAYQGKFDFKQQSSAIYGRLEGEASKLQHLSIPALLVIIYVFA